jgi:hypothetical protein
MEIALSAVTEAGRSRMAAVTAEVGAHVVLLAAQQVLPGPFHVTADSVLLSDTGEVRLLPLPAASPHEVELELRQLLAGLLALAPAAPPALKAAAERGSGGGLEALEAELHAALIPINHAAARRALARLFRETRRASGAAGASLDHTPTFAGEVTPAAHVVAATLTPVSAVPAQEASRAEPISRDALHAEPLQGDLDIDVDVVDDESSRAASSGDEVALRADAAPPVMRLGAEVLAELEDSPPPSPVSMDAAFVDVDQQVAYRSDVRELLASFLEHTRSEERMSEELRRMLGVETGLSAGTPSVKGRE